VPLLGEEPSCHPCLRISHNIIGCGGPIRTALSGGIWSADGGGDCCVAGQTARTESLKAQDTYRPARRERNDQRAAMTRCPQSVSFAPGGSLFGSSRSRGVVPARSRFWCPSATFRRDCLAAGPPGNPSRCLSLSCQRRSTRASAFVNEPPAVRTRAARESTSAALTAEVGSPTVPNSASFAHAGSLRQEEINRSPKLRATSTTFRTAHRKSRIRTTPPNPPARISRVCSSTAADQKNGRYRLAPSAGRDTLLCSRGTSVVEPNTGLCPLPMERH